MGEPELIFHDTVPIEEERLPQAREKAVIQNGIVLNFFRKRFAYRFTPVKVHEILIYEGEKILLNSVRRSITNLTKANRLIKCQWSESEEGIYGKLNRTWRYNTEYVSPINPDVSKYKKYIGTYKNVNWDKRADAEHRDWKNNT
jgi:hypothetical protein